MDESNAMALCHDVVHMAMLEVARCRETNARGSVFVVTPALPRC